MEFTNCWLEYPPIIKGKGGRLTVASDFTGPVAESALQELSQGFDGLYGTQLAPGGDAALRLVRRDGLSPEGYRITAGCGRAVIESGGSRGALYGVFALLRQLRLENCPFEEFHGELCDAPAHSLRMLNHWDNLDGSIERGYSGGSFFFRDNRVLVNGRTQLYARLIASVGYNAVVINNVNVKGAAFWLISDRYYGQLRRLQGVLARYGVDLFLSINFAAPVELGGLSTCDPCEDAVRVWWEKKAAEVWEHLPGLGGFLVKADSEGNPGPFTYGRTQAQGANLLADAIRPFGGRLIWRCFVYNCRQDWRDTRTDRARAAYDSFMPLDGAFRDNVVLQIKNGPMDFQVREPVSPLFGGLRNTKMMVEFQIAQEYTGQQRHVCYLMPWFREVLEQDMGIEDGPSRVRDLVCGMAAVCNTGDDPNWTGHDLAAANWYGFGRQSFDPDLPPEAVAEEWVRLTFGHNAQVADTLKSILMRSWPAYEQYTSPLGIGWMVTPHTHYGPSVDGYEYDRWGTYHRADRDGIGVDRSASGTGYCGQYNEPLARSYGSAETCPDELILFFHHLPYTFVLKSGKTVIQHIYDAHFEGAEQASRFLAELECIRALLPQEAYDRMYERFRHQKEHAAEWRDVVNTYFFRKSGIPDERGRQIF